MRLRKPPGGEAARWLSNLSGMLASRKIGTESGWPDEHGGGATAVDLGHQVAGIAARPVSVICKTEPRFGRSVLPCRPVFTNRPATPTHGARGNWPRFANPCGRITRYTGRRPKDHHGRT